MKEEEKSLSLLSDKIPAEKVAEILEAVKKRREQLLNTGTPKEYIRSKPMGDGRNVYYVPATYIDDTFKKVVPLYEIKFAFTPFVFQNFFVVGVEVKDKLTGNIEIGLKAHRIQVSANKKKRITGYLDANKTWHEPDLRIEDLTPFDLIDVGNDASAALTDAIKNAQSRFGVAADIYDKIVMSPEDLKMLEEDFLSILSSIDSPLMQKKMKDEWANMKSPKEKLNYINEIKERG